MSTVEIPSDERMAAVMWASGLRGASSVEESLDWAQERGLVRWSDEKRAYELTEEGSKRGEEIALSLRRIPQARRAKQRRTLGIVGGLAALAFWRWRR